MTLKLLKNRILGVKIKDFVIMYILFLWTSFHNVTKISKPVVIFRFINSQTRHHVKTDIYRYTIKII